MNWLENLDKIFAALTILAEALNLSHLFPAWEGWLVLLLAIATLVAEFIKPKAPTAVLGAPTPNVKGK